MKKWKIFIIILSAVFVTLFGFLFIYSGIQMRTVNQTKEVKLVDTEEPLVADDSEYYRAKYEKALALLGDDVEVSSYLTVVDISEQKEYVFIQGGELVHIYRISTGSGSVPYQDEDTEETVFDDRTMTESVWRVSLKRDWGLSAFYGPRLLMLDKRVDGNWISTNIALHGTNQPDSLGSPFTLGCVYHKNTDIIQLYDLLEEGDYVVAIE